MTTYAPTEKYPRFKRAQLPVGRISLGVFAGLAIASWAYILAGEDSGFADLFNAGTWQGVWGFVKELLGISTGVSPAFLNLERWGETGKQAYETLAMSVLAIGIAGTATLLTFLPAARNVGSGELTGSASLAWRALYLPVRAIFILTRGIPELTWAMIIVFIFSPGILPGAVALAVHNYGILGKLSAELVEDLDPRPARALRSSGAGMFQMMAYGIMPQVMPQFITYLLYRWEVVIRTTIVVGLLSAGGLGQEFRLSMSFFHYTDVMLLLIWYVILVIGVDLISAYLRRLVR